MKITDKNVLRQLKITNSFDLSESVKTYPDDEIDGRSQMQILADECSWILSNYGEDGHVLHDDLAQAKEIIRITQNGKVMPIWASTLKPKYSQFDIQSARNTINEHRRLVNLMKRLNSFGIYGRYGREGKILSTRKEKRMEKWKIIVANNLREMIQMALTMECNLPTKFETLLDTLEDYIANLEEEN